MARLKNIGKSALYSVVTTLIVSALFTIFGVLQTGVLTIGIKSLFQGFGLLPFIFPLVLWIRWSKG